MLLLSASRQFSSSLNAFECLSRISVSKKLSNFVLIVQELAYQYSQEHHQGRGYNFGRLFRQKNRRQIKKSNFIQPGDDSSVI
jgi:hypothetical protein